jgi:hypothetical protein
MPYSAPPTQSAGDIIGVTAWNRLATNDVWFGGGASASGYPACWAYRNTAFSTANTTVTPIGFNAQYLDNAGSHSLTVNNSRFTAPVAGWYRFLSNIWWDPQATGIRIIQTYPSATGTPHCDVGTDAEVFSLFQCGQLVESVAAFTAGQYIEVAGFQTSGGILNIRAGSWAYFAWIAAL